MEQMDPTAVQPPMQLEMFGTSITRDTPEQDPAEAALVTAWLDRAKQASEFWGKRAFKKMREDMRFAAGHQWPLTMAKSPTDPFADPVESRYVANIVLRHLQTRTATIYGKNPKIVTRRKNRLMSTIWDGNNQTLMAAMEASQNAMDPQGATSAQMIVQDALATMADNTRMTKMAKTLELLFEHELDEQRVPFKVQMKNLIRRGLTTSVGYVKLGYQRVMGRTPEVDQQMDTLRQQLATLERLSADVADGDIQPNDAEMAELKLLLQQLQTTEQAVVREGLMFTYPHSTSIIVDTNCQNLRGFVGAEWVAEEYFLTADKIKEVYQKDVGTTGNAMAKPYFRDRHGSYTAENHSSNADTPTTDAPVHRVFEIYSQNDGLVYVVCDGYPGFLVTPSTPDIRLDRFYPWFAFVVNEVYDDTTLYPPSDVRLMQNMQMELNRSRQGAREHRRAAMPKTFVRKGVLSVQDKDAIQDPEPHLVVELDGLQPGEDISKVLQGYAGPGVDPSLYDTGPAYDDYLRVLGQQEANLGGTSGSTATEASIAEGSRVSSVSAVVDDLDEFLNELVRAAGKVLLLECSKEKVQRIVGPGAVWPELTREDVAEEIYLEIEAASSGRPNKAQEVQVAQAIFPMVMQIPGVSPEFLAKEMLRRMDDRMDLTDAFAPGVPSVMMLNRMTQTMGGAPGAAGPGGPPTGAPPENDPNAQGAEGGNNAPDTQPPQVNAAPRPPGRPPLVALPAAPGL